MMEFLVGLFFVIGIVCVYILLSYAIPEDNTSEHIAKIVEDMKEGE